MENNAQDIRDIINDEFDTFERTKLYHFCPGDIVFQKEMLKPLAEPLLQGKTVYLEIEVAGWIGACL